MTLNNPLIASQVETCSACPEQYEGRLLDGRLFYFHFRGGRASLSVGWTPSEVFGHKHVSEQVTDDGLQGVFDDQEQRDATFDRLLERWLRENDPYLRSSSVQSPNQP
jgi:hypothetical protein